MDKRISNILPKLRKASIDQNQHLSEIGTITSSTFPQQKEIIAETNHEPLSLKEKVKLTQSYIDSLPSSVKIIQKKMSRSQTEKSMNKKIKILKDGKEKIKIRFNTLLEILNDLPDYEKPNFFIEHAEAIFDTTGSMFLKLVTKIKQKGNSSINSKEILSLYKTFPILKMIFLHLREKVKQGWQEETLLLLLTQLLHYGNHPKLREQGFELLLLWISILKTPNEGPIWLYRNSIALDVYAFDKYSLNNITNDVTGVGYSKMGQELIHVDDRTPLVLNPSPQSYHDSNNLFIILLKNLIKLSYIASGFTLSSNLDLTDKQKEENGFPNEDYYQGMGMDSAYASVKFMFLLFQNFYLAKLFPINNQDLFSPATQSQFNNLQNCPPSLLRIFILFLVQNCLDDGFKLRGLNQFNINNNSQYNNNSEIRSSPACPILKKLIFSTNVSRDFINDILRQSLNLIKFGFNQQAMETVRGAILIIGTWFLADDNEKPVFLRPIISNNNNNETNANNNYKEHVLYYLRLLQSTINFNIEYSILDKIKRNSREDMFNTTISDYDTNQQKNIGKAHIMELTEYQAKCYEEIFLIFKAIISNSNDSFNLRCKRFVCEILLELNEQFLYLLENEPTLILSHATGKFECKSKWLNFILDSLHETLFYAWSCSNLDDKSLWLSYQQSLINSTILPTAIKHWCITLKRITRILINKLYGLELDFNRIDLLDLLNYGTKKINKGGIKNIQSKKELVKLKENLHKELRNKEYKRSSSQTSNKINLVKKNLSISRRGSTKISNNKLSLDETINNNNSNNNNNNNINNSNILSNNNNSNNNLSDIYGFYLLSNYYKLIIHPSLPRSSTSSIHSSHTHSSSQGSQQTPNSLSPKITNSLSPIQTNDDNNNNNNNNNTQLERNNNNNIYGHCIFDHTFNKIISTEINYSILNWNSSEAIFLWKNILSCLGNINEIKSNRHQEITLKCIVEVYDALQSIKSFRSPHQINIPCIKEMSIWIIGALDLPSIYENGKSIAFEWMCRVMSHRRTHDKFLLLENPLSFYQQLLKALTSKNPKLFQIILEQGTFAFSRMLPGINLLAPTLVDTIKFMLEEPKPNIAGRTRLPEELRQKCITMLASLLHLPYQFKGMELPNLNQLKSSIKATNKPIKVEEIGQKIKSILHYLLDEDEWSTQLETYPTTYSMIICALCVQTTHEIGNINNLDKQLIKSNLTAILDQLYSSHYILVNSAIDCISSFALTFSNLILIDSSYLRSILEDIIGAIKVHLNLLNNNSSSQNRYVLTRLFACLLEWLMISPKNLFLESKLEKAILGILERAIIENQTKNLMCSDVKDAANVVLYQLINHFGMDFRIQNQFSLETDLIEMEYDTEILSKCEFIAFNDNVIFAIYPPNSLEKKCLKIRNFLGKFAWDINNNNNNNNQKLISEEDNKPIIETINNNNNQQEENEIEFNWNYPIEDKPNHLITNNEEDNEDNLIDNYIEFEEPPMFDYEEPLLNKIDMLESALDFVEQSFEDHGYSHWVRTIPNRKVIQSKHIQTEGNDNNNNEYYKILYNENKNNNESNNLLREHQTLLSYLQIISTEKMNYNKLAMLKNSDSFIRDLKALDRKHSRETIKIALIYVKDGQTSEDNILLNESSSIEFESFTKNLGWEVELKTHGGYLGGLERNGVNGKTSIYYSNPTLEIMYHDITRMPNDIKDIYQVKKKRHVGNDPVHIVWNENQCDYSPLTIGGDFGNAQIIIHPMKNQLFDIRIYKDGQCGHFGPLITGMVIPKNILASLVRTTAINAYRSILCRSLNYNYNALHPSIERSHEIHAMIRKHKIDGEGKGMELMKKIYQF